MHRPLSRPRSIWIRDEWVWPVCPPRCRCPVCPPRVPDPPVRVIDVPVEIAGASGVVRDDAVAISGRLLTTMVLVSRMVVACTWDRRVLECTHSLPLRCSLGQSLGLGREAFHCPCGPVLILRAFGVLATSWWAELVCWSP